MEYNIQLKDVDVAMLVRLLGVVGELQRVQADVTCGFAADHIDNAFEELRKAMRMLGS